MKLNPNAKPIQMYNPRQEMKYLKEALKKDYLYSTDEIRTLKRRLTILRNERSEPNSTGLGFSDL
jgi:hypothetical protein